MEIRRLGKTGMQVARIDFGGMTIPKVGVERAVEEILQALQTDYIDLYEPHDVGLFVMKVFGNARLLDLCPPGKDRKPTVDECQSSLKG